MDVLIRSGYLYELVGLAFYVFFVVMSRRRNAARFSQRSKVLTLLAAIALVACVPLHYAAQPLGMLAMLVLAAAAVASTWNDARAKSP